MRASDRQAYVAAAGRAVLRARRRWRGQAALRAAHAQADQRAQDLARSEAAPGSR